MTKSHEAGKETSLTPARMAVEAVGKYVNLVVEGEEEMARDLRNSLIESVPEEEQPWVRQLISIHRRLWNLIEGAEHLPDDELDVLWGQLKDLVAERI